MEDKKEDLPINIDGDINWEEYYDKITPKIPDEELEEMKKKKSEKSPFSPDFDEPEKLVDHKLDEETYKWFKTQKKIEADYAGVEEEEIPLEEMEYDEFLEGNDIEGGEEVDQDFQEEEEESDEEEIKERGIYRNPLPNDGDNFLIIIEEDEQMVDKILSVKNVEKDENKIIFEDEEKNDLVLYLDDDLNILLESDEYKYKIIDFEKIEEFNIKDLDDEELFLTKDIYQEIELDVEEIKDKKYTIQEKKESLITELISIFKAYNNKKIILDICEIADNYEKMLIENSNKDFDYSDLLPFLKNIKKNDYNLPKWLIPIADNI